MNHCNLRFGHITVDTLIRMRSDLVGDRLTNGRCVCFAHIEQIIILTRHKVPGVRSDATDVW